MSATSVVGLQWGDEAKGKIVDLLTGEHDIVVRYQGGNNAGHTVKFDGQTYKLHLLPTGVLSDHIVSVVAPGVVIDPASFLGEMDGIAEKRGEIEPNRLLISDRAHVIMPYHKVEEAVDANANANDIGTTMRGIGPCYREKAGRGRAIRVGDLIRPDVLKARLKEIVPQKNTVIKAQSPDTDDLCADAIFEEYSVLADRLRPYVANTTAFLHKALDEKKRLLFEGAQGSLLDLDHGTFPYVTSSSSSGCGVHSGSGVSEREITRMIGIVKAYSTRVGGGPFPTEQDNDTGEHIRQKGHEFGTTTGRPRRCGWFDAVATRYSARLSGVDCVAIMLLDVLAELEEIKICEAYEINGERTTDFPSHSDDLSNVKPVYRTVPGWQQEITEVRNFDDLPKAAKDYVHTVSELLGFPVEIVSVGPDREQTIFVEQS